MTYNDLKTIQNKLKPSPRAYIIKAACSYNRDRAQNKCFLRKQKQNKIKIGIDRHDPFSRLYPKIEST